MRLSKLPAAFATLATLRRATRGTKISAGLGVLVTLGITAGVTTGYIEGRDAVDLYELTATAITSAIAAFEYLGKRQVQRGVETLQATTNIALPEGAQIKVDGEPGPVTQSAHEYVTIAAAENSPEVLARVHLPEPSAPPVRKPRWRSSGMVKPTRPAPPAPPKLHGGRGR
jgi:hypothetical protein